ncbi:dihydropteroate synthase [Mangrovitalea sediminis]|uniref:dihydropteroate synthase n=1 Tax=Mangrovitalea sediminis TaxID=1982043 RepID=UPI000BE618D4|nr:dihydropteroate synthase [Mangrovitalea sediminis]
MEMTFAGRTLDLSRPRVMGILNITPDSFSDGGRFLGRDEALRHVDEMISAGADFIDVGGESTRPGAAAVSVQEELDRVCPMVAAIRERFDVVISVDTSTPAVMLESGKIGAGLINDVRALGRPGALDAAHAAGLPVCLMHMQGEPDSMQKDPRYDSDVTREVLDFLARSAERAYQAGIGKENILLDPGFGFGKTLKHNLQLMRDLPVLANLGYPLLIGMSRKTMIGQITGREVGARVAGSVAGALLSVMRGAAIVRVHDVAETIDALKVWGALREIE